MTFRIAYHPITWMLSIFVFFASIAEPSGMGEDLYWISFAQGTNAPSNIYLMQIDDQGNVTIEPELVVSEDQLNFPTSAQPALGPKSSTTFHLWVNACFPCRVWRARVAKSDLAITSFADTGLQPVYASLQATQYAAKSFLLAGIGPGGTAHVIFVKSNGSPTGQMIGLPTASNPVLSVAPDGRMAVARDVGSPLGGIYVQPLSAKAKPNSPTKFPPPRDIGSMDVSNVVSGNWRFFVFWDEAANNVFLQRIDADTGDKVGQEKLVASQSVTTSLALEPEGRFLVYAVQSSCGVQLYFQALNPNGDPSGESKTLVACTPFLRGLDIMKEQ